jgi:ATP-dependent 26S proteasome regulatory subunit
MSYCWMTQMLMDSWECEQVCTAKMNLSEEVDLEDYVSRPDKISAAEVRFSTCTTPPIPAGD